MGVFITIEGPDGVGKTTFIDKLSKRLSLTRTIYKTREPTETQFGNFVKKNEGNFTGYTYAHLIATDRAYHLENFIVPSINQYDIVLSDRYIESSLVLQRFDGVDIDYIWKLNDGFLKPDISIILVADNNLIINRLSERENLSAYEKRMTPSEEIELYISAYEFIKKQGFNAYILENNTINDCKKNIDKIIKIIENIERSI